MSSYFPPVYSSGAIPATSSTSSDDLALPSNKVRHVVIRGVQVAEKPSPYVVRMLVASTYTVAPKTTQVSHTYTHRFMHAPRVHTHTQRTCWEQESRAC